MKTQIIAVLTLISTFSISETSASSVTASVKVSVGQGERLTSTRKVGGARGTFYRWDSNFTSKRDLRIVLEDIYPYSYCNRSPFFGHCMSSGRGIRVKFNGEQLAELVTYAREQRRFKRRKTTERINRIVENCLINTENTEHCSFETKGANLRNDLYTFTTRESRSKRGFTVLGGFSENKRMTSEILITDRTPVNGHIRKAQHLKIKVKFGDITFQ